MDANAASSNIIRFPAASVVSGRWTSVGSQVGNIVRGAACAAAIAIAPPVAKVEHLPMESAVIRSFPKDLPIFPGLSLVIPPKEPTSSPKSTDGPVANFTESSAQSVRMQLHRTDGTIVAKNLAKRIVGEWRAWDCIVLVNSGTVIMNPDKILDAWTEYLIAENAEEAHAIGRDIRENLNDNQNTHQGGLPKYRSGYVANEIRKVEITENQAKNLTSMFKWTRYARMMPHDLVLMVTNVETGSGRLAMEYLDKARTLKGRQQDQAILNSARSLLGGANDVGPGQFIPDFVRYMKASHPELDGPIKTENKVLQDLMVRVFYRAIEWSWNHEMVFDALAQLDVRFDVRRIVPSIVDAHIDSYRILRTFHLPAITTTELTLASYNLGLGRAMKLAAKIASAHRDGQDLSVDDAIREEWLRIQDIGNRRTELARLHRDGDRHPVTAASVSRQALPASAVPVASEKQVPASTGIALEGQIAHPVISDQVQRKTAEIIQLVPKSKQMPVASYLLQGSVQGAIAKMTSSVVGQDNASNATILTSHHARSGRDRGVDVTRRDEVIQNRKKLLQMNAVLRDFHRAHRAQEIDLSWFKNHLQQFVMRREEVVAKLAAMNDNEWLEEHAAA